MLKLCNRLLQSGAISRWVAFSNSATVPEAHKRNKAGVKQGCSLIHFMRLSLHSFRWFNVDPTAGA